MFLIKIEDVLWLNSTDFCVLIDIMGTMSSIPFKGRVFDFQTFLHDCCQSHQFLQE